MALVERSQIHPCSYLDVTLAQSSLFAQKYTDVARRVHEHFANEISPYREYPKNVVMAEIWCLREVMCSLSDYPLVWKQ